MKSLTITFRGILLASMMAPIFTPAFAATAIDTTLITKPTVAATPNFAMQQFASCSDMRDKVADFMELYYTAHPPYNYWGGGGIRKPMDGDMPVMSQSNTPMAPSAVGESIKKTSDAGSVGNSADYSTTNSRTLGVDEPEKVKTDGKYIYTARIENKAIYINKADDSLELLTKIILPSEFNSAELFVQGNKLVVIAGKYFWNESFTNAWIDRSNKAIVIVYDITNIQKPVIDRYSQIDGYVSEVRLTGGQLTVMTSTNFNFPIHRYLPTVQGTNLQFDMQKLSTDFNTQVVLPRRIEFRSDKKTGDVNTAIAKARSMKRLIDKDAINCQSINYVLPDAATLKDYNFNPTFTTITKIDINNSLKATSTSMMFGDVGKAYLAASGKLYITSTLYNNGGNASCPPGMMCIMRWIEPGTQTIVHQFDTTPLRVKYLRTGVVPGSLISDYAIDENTKGEVRLVTQKTGTERESQLYILNSNLGKISELTRLGKGESFQSSRFIGNRLYLVTFQQIDPLFVIDVSNSLEPKVLGELKIPGYSTYLHPYDDNRLIGIGYDTKTNEWGGTTNSGIKIDLYNVADVTKPTQEATLTLGTAGSYSEALANPRLFVWQKSKNTLYLPAQIMTSTDTKNSYNYSDAFQGLISLKIDASSTENKIKETARISHIEWDEAALLKQRDTDCEAYRPKAKICRKLTTGEEVCTDGLYSSYVPEYCYADVGIGAYKASQIWQKSDQFIDRVLYAGDRTFSFSQYQIRSLNNQSGLTPMGKVNLEDRTKLPSVPQILPIR